MDKTAKSQQLSIYLAKKTVTDVYAAVKPDSYSYKFEFNLESSKAHLFVKDGDLKYPKWVNFFDDFIKPSKFSKARNISALLIVPENGRLFLIAFGTGGRFLISDDIIQPRFGLNTTLNSIEVSSLRSIDKQSLDNLESQSRIQSSYETSSDSFGIDVEQDMLKAVVGTPTNKSLGSRMTGSDSLSVTVKARAPSLPKLLRQYLKNSQKNLAGTPYDWVNNIAPVKHDTALQKKLEAALNTKLAGSDHSNLWLSIPEIIPWELVKGFIYTHGKRIIHKDINLPGFVQTLKRKTLTVDLLRTRRVSCADADHNKVFKDWAVFSCLYAEIEAGGASYVLNDGSWFQIEKDFVEQTNVRYAKIEKSKLQLPKFLGGGEGAYNQMVADSNPGYFAILDDKKKVFHGGGHGQVEICDLFTSDKNLIHVKKYGKSSVLSHLFSQGFVSGQLIQLDEEFRKKFRDRLPDSFKGLVTTNKRPDEKEYVITFAVISDEPGDDLHLPFFSRVNLNNTEKILKGFGYRVELLKIPHDDYAVTQIGLPA